MVTGSWSPDLVVGNIFEKILGWVDNIGKDIKFWGGCLEALGLRI